MNTPIEYRFTYCETTMQWIKIGPESPEYFFAIPADEVLDSPVELTYSY